MKQGRTIEGLASELLRQAESKRDFVVSTKAIEINVEPETDAENAPLVPVVCFQDEVLKPNANFHRQLAEHVGIPAKYYDRMKTEAPHLLAENVNEWLHRGPDGERRMIRELDGKARALLSDRYRRLDNFDLARVALPSLKDAGAIIMSGEVTEDRFYLKAIDEKITKDIPKGLRLGEGHTGFDTVCAALTLSNSEIGKGTLMLSTSIFTRMCTNLSTYGDRSIRQTHVGGKHEIGEEVYALLSDETRAVDDASFWGKVRDLTRAAFSAVEFEKITEKMIASASDRIEADPVRVVEITQERLGLTEDERAAVLRQLIEGADLTRYGLSNAITRAAQDVSSYDRATEMERLGGSVVELSKDGWKQILDAASSVTAAPKRKVAA